MSAGNLDRALIAEAIADNVTRCDADNALNIVVSSLTKGDVLRVPFVSGSGVSSFSSGTGYATDTTGINGVNVTLDKHYFKELDLTDDQLNKMSPQHFATEIAFRAATLQAAVVSQSLAGTISSANFASTAAYSGSAYSASVALADLDSKSLNFLGKKYLVAGSTLVTALGQNSQYVNASVLGSSGFAQEGGGVNVYGWQTLKTGITIPANLTGFLCSKQAITVVCGELTPPANAVNTRVEPFVLPSGLRMQYREFYDDTKGKQVRVVECIFGYAATSPNALIRIP